MQIILTTTPGVVTNDLLARFGVTHPRTYAARLRERGFDVRAVTGFGWRLQRT